MMCSGKRPGYERSIFVELPPVARYIEEVMFENTFKNIDDVLWKEAGL